MKQLVFFVLLGALFFSCKHKEKINWLKLDHSNEIQRFRISTQKDTVISGIKGTLIKISNNSFADENGLDVDSVEITLEEFYTIQDFIANRLSTKTTDGRILRSSGMINIHAESNGKKVFLKEEKQVKLGFPRVQNAMVANLFRGIKEENGEIVWDLLGPVHIDTIGIRNEYIKMLSYGAEEVSVWLSVAIGYDTIDITNSNWSQFDDLFPLDNGSSEDISTIASLGNLDFPFEKDKFYIFMTTSFGWINCDIFLEEELFPFVVKTSKSNSDVFIVLDSLNSVLYPDSINRDNNEYVFNLPKEKTISISAYTKEHNTHYFGLKKLNSSLGAVSINQFEQKLEDVKKSIQTLK